MHQRGKSWKIDFSFRQHVAMNIDGVVKRAETLACKLEREQVRTRSPTQSERRTKCHPTGHPEWDKPELDACAADSDKYDLYGHKHSEPG